MKKKLTIFLSLKLFLYIFLIFFFQKIYADEAYNKGKEIFLGDGNCASCHSLADAGSNGDIGPNLNEIQPELSRVIMAVKNGIGVMPAYEGILTDKEIELVSKYVSESSLK